MFCHLCGNHVNCIDILIHTTLIRIKVRRDLERVTCSLAVRVSVSQADLICEDINNKRKMQKETLHISGSQSVCYYNHPQH